MTASAFATLFKGVLQGLGISTGWGLILQIITAVKPLMQVVGGLIKMITMLLKPISDVITTLLYPILMLMKPIAIAIRTMMLPFLRLSLKAMAEGAKAIVSGDLSEGLKLLGMGALDILNGLSLVLFNIQFETIEMFGEIIFQSLLFIVGVIFPSLKNKANEFMSGYNSITDDLQKHINDTMIKNIAEANEAVGVNIGNFEDKAMGAFSDFFTNDSNSIENQSVEQILNHTEATEKTIKEIINGGKGLVNRFGSWTGRLEEAAKEEVERIFAIARAKAAAAAKK